MNIAPIFFGKLNNYKTTNTNNYADNRLIKPNYRNQLTQDTVSFGMGAISDTIWHNFVKDIS